MPDFKSKFDGPQIDEAITIALGLNIINNGWLRIPSSEEYPINLDLLTNIGNFTIGYFINGSEFMMTTKPLNISILSINNVIYQYSLIKDNIEYRKLENSVWTIWGISKSSSYIYQQDTEPVGVDIDSLWIDTHLTAGPYPIKVLKETGWKEITPSNMMDKNIYDSGGIATDLYTAIQAYIEDFKTTNNLGTLSDNLNSHIIDIVLHTTAVEKTTWNNKETPTSAQSKVDLALVEAKSYTDTEIAEAVSETGTVSSDLAILQTSFSTHNNDTVKHITATERTIWNAKAEGNHAHLKDGKVQIDAADVVSGVFSIDRIPKGALERIVEVADNTARFALTITEVQTGDSVYITSTKEFYFVVDDTQLSVAAGYQLYSSGVASSVLWTNVKNKPTTLSGYGITDTYTKTETAAIVTNITTELELYTDEKIDILDNIVKLNISEIIVDAVMYFYDNIIFINNLFIATARNSNQDGLILTSPDLITWTIKTNIATYSMISIIFINNLFVAIKHNINGDGTIVTSLDLITWEAKTTMTLCELTKLSYYNGLFIVTGYDSNDDILIRTSTDLITWENITTNIIVESINIIYNNGLYIASGYDYDEFQVIITSTDLITWTTRLRNESYSLKDMIYDNGLYVASGYDYDTNHGIILTSLDAITWETITIDILENKSYILYCNGVYVLLSYNENAINYPTILISLDSINWFKYATLEYKYPYKQWHISYINNKLVIMNDNNNTLLVSPINIYHIIEAIGNINNDIIPLNIDINNLCYNINGQKNISLMQEAFSIAYINQTRLINAETNVTNLTENITDSLATITRILNLVG